MTTPHRKKLGFDSAGILLAPEEFDQITDYDDRYRYELIHGVLVVNPIPSEAEAGPNEELGRMLLNYRDQHPQGSTLDATLPERYVPTAGSRRRADRVIWAGLGRTPDPRHDIPTVVVEFVSAGKRDHDRDYVEKKQEYAQIGVAEYWIIDRFRRVMTIYRNPPSGSEEQVVQEQESCRTPLLPGFELPLARLLAVADAWQQAERNSAYPHPPTTDN